MDIRNCRRCGRLFSFALKPICPVCLQQEDEFEIVRSYLKENPGSRIKKISEKTGVASGQIVKFFRDGRLELADGMSPLIECEKCGKPIFMGRFCQNCMNSLHKQFEQATKPTKSGSEGNDEQGVSMHLSKIKKTK